MVTAELNFESKFKHLPGMLRHLAITRRQLKVLTAKSIAKLLGLCTGTALADLTGKNKHRVFPSCRQSLLASTC